MALKLMSLEPRYDPDMFAVAALAGLDGQPDPPDAGTEQLIIGAEGQLGIITAAVMKLHHRPVERVTAMVAMEALDNAPVVLNALQDASGGAVVAFEFMPRNFIEGHFKVDPKAREPF